MGCSSFIFIIFSLALIFTMKSEVELIFHQFQIISLYPSKISNYINTQKMMLFDSNFSTYDYQNVYLSAIGEISSLLGLESELQQVIFTFIFFCCFATTLIFSVFSISIFDLLSLNSPK